MDKLRAESVRQPTALERFVGNASQSRYLLHELAALESKGKVSATDVLMRRHAKIDRIRSPRVEPGLPCVGSWTNK